MLVDAILTFLRENSIEPSSVLVAVSGGFDSTALLLALNELRDIEIEWDAERIEEVDDAALEVADRARAHRVGRRRGEPAGRGVLR